MFRAFCRRARFRSMRALVAGVESDGHAVHRRQGGRQAGAGRAEIVVRVLPGVGVLEACIVAAHGVFFLMDRAQSGARGTFSSRMRSACRPWLSSMTIRVRASTV